MYSRLFFLSKTCLIQEFVLRNKQDATVHDLAIHATFITKLQHGLHTTEAPFPRDEMDKRRRKSGYRGGNVNHINWNSSSSIKILARMHGAIDLDPCNLRFPFGTNRCNASQQRFRPHRQQLRSMMQYSALPVCRATTQ